MQQSDLKDALALEKKLYAKLTEVLDATQQLAEAVDRQDPVSIRMLLSMRQSPIYELEEIRGQLELKECDLSKEDAAHYHQLLSGKIAPLMGEEALAQQVAANQRLLRRVVELDRSVNRRLAGERSCYGDEG